MPPTVSSRGQQKPQHSSRDPRPKTTELPQSVARGALKVIRSITVKEQMGRLRTEEEKHEYLPSFT